MSYQKSTLPKNIKKLNQVDAYEVASDCLRELYSTEAGQKFVHHLIYAFASGKNTIIVFSKKPIYDCLTKSLIEPVYSPERPIDDDFVSKKLVEINTCTEEQSEQKQQLVSELNSYIESLVTNSTRTRIAVRSELTNKIIGCEELTALSDFIKDQVQNKKNTIIKGMVKFLTYKESDKPEKKSKPKKVKKVAKPTGNTLMDDDDIRTKLEALKKKYE